MMKKEIIYLLFSSLVMIACNPKEYYLNQGEIFKTTYHIKYKYHRPVDLEIERRLNEFDLSLNPFNHQSTIYKVNNNIPCVLDDYFIEMFKTAQEISARTHGAFDITTAPLINLWGFGYNHSLEANQQAIDSVRQFVGYEKVRLIGRTVEKEDPRIQLNASAIAKGFACDVLADMLDTLGVSNYMIEIGGEVRVKGLNPHGVCWKIEISKPSDDNTGGRLERQEVMDLCNKGMATSGNYRNYYIKDGKKYAHTINPKTGYPEESDLLSASVIAGQCMIADAYATAFMVMGADAAESLAKQTPEISYYFVCNRNGNEEIRRNE